MIPKKHFAELEKRVRTSDGLSDEQAAYLTCLVFQLTEGLAHSRGTYGEVSSYRPDELDQPARSLIANIGEEGGYTVEFEDHLEKNLVIIRVIGSDD